MQFAADGFQRREADGSRLARLEYREVGLRQVDTLCQLAKGYLPLGHFYIEINDDLSHTLCRFLDGQLLFFLQLLHVLQNPGYNKVACNDEDTRPQQDMLGQ